MQKLNSKYLFIISGIVITSLIVVQLYWILNTIQLQKVSNESALKEDIATVIKEVEEGTYCFNLYSKTTFDLGEGIYVIKQSFKDGNFYGTEKGGTIDTLNMFNVFETGKDSMFMNDKYVTFENYRSTLDVTYKFRLITESTPLKKVDSVDVKDLTIDNFKELLTDKRSAVEFINLPIFNKLIKEALLKNNLDTNYTLGIKKIGDSQYSYLSQGASITQLNKSKIRSSLMSTQFDNTYELVLYVPNSFTNIIKSMSIMMVSSIIIIIILCLLYVYFVRTILNQKRLSSMKNTFINNITHEFRTPITNINLAIENWQENKSNDNLYMKIIDEENKHMERNVEQILQLAMLEHKNEYVERTSVNVHKLIEGAIKSFEIQIDNVSGSIITKLNAEVPFIDANKGQIDNLIHNLIDNAIKYRNEKPVIEISTYIVDSRFVLQVKDNGIGMSTAVQAHIFDRFYRANSTDTHDVKGFGLGLSYAKYIIDAHDGEIVVKSKEGRGTQFTIYLPQKCKK